MHLKKYYQYKLYLKVLSIKFPSKHFLLILGILSIKFHLKVLSFKFPLECFLLILGILLISKTRCGSYLAGTFKRLDVAHSLLAILKDQMWLIVCWHFQKTRCGR